jgi:DNA-binding MarR family transcriptional regulator
MPNGRDHPLAAATVVALDQLLRVVQTSCFTAELPPVQWSALRYLARADASTRSIAALAAYSGVNHSSASRTLAALRAKGLIDIHPTEHHGRTQRLDLTPKGWECLNADPLHHLTDCITDLPPQDMVALRRLVEELLLKISRRAVGAGRSERRATRL